MKRTITYQFDDGDERFDLTVNAVNDWDKIYKCYREMHSYRDRTASISDELYDRISDWMALLYEKTERLS